MYSAPTEGRIFAVTQPRTALCGSFVDSPTLARCFSVSNLILLAVDQPQSNIFDVALPIDAPPHIGLRPMWGYMQRNAYGVRAVDYANDCKLIGRGASR